MGNTFTGGAHEISLSNGNTSAFIDVMMLAASATVTTEWGYRFAGRIALSDQNVFGLGMVGFALEDFDWGKPGEDAAANKDLVLDTLALAASRYRWDDLDYSPPLIGDVLRRFQAMVEDFDTDTAAAEPDGDCFPGPEDVVARSCLRHRVLAPLVANPDCVFCDGR
ncbi:hypothetical protein ABIA31_002717 [Catenulispora sp. MAP5-51]|uniref:hypothetical protein n=1 Tax=Catenulispora sp. MAP5-51 TaxID=3156298 RepID=UPI003511F561